MEPFVLKTLKRLKKESPRRFKDLRIICDELIVALTEKEKANGENNVESDADQYFEPLEAACDTRQPRLMEIALDALHFLIEHGYLKGKRKVATSIFSTDEGENEPKIQQNRTLMDAIIETVSKCSDEFDDGVQLQVIKALLTAITSLQCEVHEASLLLSVRACFHIHLITKNQVNKTTAKAALTQMLSVVNQRMEIADITSSKLESNSSEDGRIIISRASDSQSQNIEISKIDESSTSLSVEKSSGITTSFQSIYHKDSYLLFRALCKLSMKGPLNDDAGAQSDHIALQNKILSLELILNILQNCGNAFRTGEKFIYAIRSYLCVSLLGNCTSQVAQVTGLSLQIFVVLMQNFKEHLKSEMEVFVSTIFLRILESENSTYDHKFRVLEVFQTICKDPSTLVELFINYDCDLDAINLFSRLVDGFAKIAKNPLISVGNRSVTVDFISSSGKKLQNEEQNLRIMGLEGLVIIVRSLEHLGVGISNIGMKTKIITNLVGEDTIREQYLNQTQQLENIASEEDYQVEIEEQQSSKQYVNNNVSTNVSVENTKYVVGVFDKKQKIQEEIENGILKFNLSSKKGIAYLGALKHIELTPKGVANFLHQYQDRLDKTVVGDYLGREREYENGFAFKVLHEYVAALDFSGLAFDLAIRRFLNGFRLPGEAQKIDRIMEKFAERYFLQNKNTFASADMAFILAFSTIMLQTNLHNPAIRDDKRMTKDQFIKQNKGISADGELPDEMLSEIYDRIAAEPISITEDDKLAKRFKSHEQSSFVVFQASTDRRKKDAFNNERKEMVKAGEAMIKQYSKRAAVTTFRNASHSDENYVKPMFEVVWPPIIGVMSQILETFDDSHMIQLCIEGFLHSIRLSCRLDLPISRNTFVNSLAKFTTLETVREMKQKNVLSIKLLMNIALSEGEYLEESWGQILQNISQLARLQLFANGSLTDDLFFSESALTSSSNEIKNNRRGNSTHNGTVKINFYDKQHSSDAFTKLFLGPSKAETTRLTEEANAEMVMRDIDPVQIDRVFLNSVSLSGESVGHFVKCLCEVSLLEISTSSSMNSLRGKDSSADSSTPRIFSLQKLVEVADCNMYSRSRIDWSNIWNLLARHFSSVGLHENQALAMYAIDSLKQLSIKFLQKEELSNFNFQRVFLKPFEVIMQRSKSIEIKDLILRCLDIMIKACSNNIHSGWRSIFAIFEVAAGQDSLEIANIAFEITEQLMDHFDLLVFDFVGIMNCLVAFVASTHTTLSLKALNYLSRCADHLAEGTINSIASTAESSINKGTPVHINEMNQINEDASVFRLWWPLLLGLSARVSDVRLQVRVKALNTLHSVLHNYGHLFSPQTWSVIFKGVLFPIVDSAKTDATIQPRSVFPTENPAGSTNAFSWIGTMGLNVLTVCLELYQKFKEKDDFVPLLPDLISMLESCICQDTESLAKMGLRVLNDLVLSMGKEKALMFKDGTSKNVVLLEGPHADLVCVRITKCMMKNICIEFGQLGSIKMNKKEIPIDIQKKYTSECPLALRKKSKEGNSTPQTNSSRRFSENNVRLESFNTPFGNGFFSEFVEADFILDLPARASISLGWGKLYSCDENTTNIILKQQQTEIKIKNENIIATPLQDAVDNTQLMFSAMTSMVCKHYSSFLTALETYHWHAYCFNESIPLRYNLAEKSFMRKKGKQQQGFSSSTLPHLLDQEVRSIELMLKIIYKLYNLADESGFDQEYFQPWLERISLIVLNHYLFVEEEEATKENIILNIENAEQLEKNSQYLLQEQALNVDLFLKERHEGYRNPVLIVLEGINAFTQKKFSVNIKWIVPVLSRLIICANKDIRLKVRAIYTSFVNGLLFEAKS